MGEATFVALGVTVCSEPLRRLDEAGHSTGCPFVIIGGTCECGYWEKKRH